MAARRVAPRAGCCNRFDWDRGGDLPARIRGWHVRHGGVQPGVFLRLRRALLMRAGFIASGVGHGALLLGALVLLAGPKPFVTVPPDAITVDIIGADAIPSGDATRQPWAESAAAPEPSGRDREQQPEQDPAENPQSSTASAPPQPPLPQEQRAS